MRENAQGLRLLKNARRTLRHTWQFSKRVLSHFVDNKGLLLAGSLAYNTLLSVIPLATVLLIGLSEFFDDAQLKRILSTEFAVVVPGNSNWLTNEVSNILAARGVIGILGLLIMLFFSSLAFKMLEDALSVIFVRVPPRPNKRSKLVSFLRPYGFVVLVGLGLMVITTLVVVLEVLAESRFGMFFGYTWSLGATVNFLLRFSGFLGLVMLCTTFYRALPPAKVSFRRALVGGFFAALLWDVVRRILVWYFSSISMVSVLYGSLTTVIVLLLTLEVAAVIILLGGQVIAELERSAAVGLPWYMGVDDVPTISSVHSAEKVPRAPVTAPVETPAIDPHLLQPAPAPTLNPSTPTTSGQQSPAAHEPEATHPS